MGAIGALLAGARVDINYPWLFGSFVCLHLVVWDGYADIVQFLLECPRVAVNQASVYWQMVSNSMVTERDHQILGILLQDRRQGEEAPGREGWVPTHRTGVRVIRLS